ncbi:TniQ family protein [Curtobacterium sp. 260]|uniref:TniQ family protein n=1 Tax=Curtobacterium sp. 260 TaxID=2817748 RepID=UPI002DD436FF|nr:TniQ family protein [Curtobacterium sp. 260]
MMMNDRSRPEGSLPIRLHPHDDEWLPTALNRWAWNDFDSPPADLDAALEIDTLHPNEVRALGTSIQPAEMAALVRATGLTPIRLQGMTLSQYDGRALTLKRTANHLESLRSDFPWVRRSGTRFCPPCLAEKPGVFLMGWRFNWTFVCLEHRQVLSDVCPGCGLELPEPHGSRTRPRDPNRCNRRICTSFQDFYCETRLDGDTHSEQLPADSPILRAQRLINDVIERAASPSRELRALVSLMGSVRSAASTASIADLAGVAVSELVGLIEPEPHAGGSPPPDALSFGALAAAAVRLRDDPEPQVAKALREITFNRPPTPAPRSAGLGPGSIKELLGRWGKVRAPMTDRIVRALDKDLSPVTRVRTRSAVSAPEAATVVKTTPAQNRYRAVSLPKRLWSAWAVPLHLDLGANLETVADAFAATLDIDASKPELRPTMIGHGEQREKVVRALALLETQLVVGGSPIDYGRRRGLPWQRLLPDEAWQQICESDGSDPGTGRRAVLARRYMHMRLTGGGPQHLPEQFKRTRRDDAAQETAFLLRLTDDLQKAMDAYTRAFLVDEECELLWTYGYSPTRLTTEPLVWSPERSDLARRLAVGPELGDIDTSQLHALMADGDCTLTELSSELGRTVAHVKLAIDAWPPPVSRGGEGRDW